ncbi:PAS domain-containing protein [Flavobacterium sp. RSB2_4_14]|uniref:PAS domain-containing protein n=1 Tax=Flavobacterium sp. RSB2_4_14 TaxID=3447665 RepID=UPI003F3F5D02
MLEFKEYEIAVDKYHKTMSIKQYPLISWEFFLSAFDKYRISLPDVASLTKISKVNKWNENWNFQNELLDENVIVVTDTKLKIVFASQNIIAMNGYKPIEVIGNSPKMFQGKLTDPKVSKAISIAVKEQKPFSQTIFNYCKDGSLYKCHIKGYPVFDKKGKLTNFIAFEKIAA